MESQQYKLLNIALTESIFKRKPVLDFSVEYEIQTDLNLNVSRNENKLQVSLQVNINSGKNEDPDIYISVTYTATFEIPEKPILSVEKFQTINAPAIIFPFIREQIANLTWKAQIPPIVLPPLNFQKLAEQLEAKDNK